MGAIPDFAHLDLGRPSSENRSDWERRLAASGRTVQDLVWDTPEGIEVRPVYAAADCEGLDFLDGWPGIAP